MNRAHHMWLVSLLVLTASLAGAPRAVAQAPLPVQTIDLATTAALTRDVSPDAPFELRIVNLVPNAKYSYEIRRVIHTIEPLALVKTYSADAPCPTLDQAVAALDSEDVVEANVAGLAATVRGALAGCSHQPTLQEAEDVLAKTARTLVLSVPRGEMVVVTLRREKNLLWTATFDAGRRGEWQGSYGFVYAPPDNERYFTKATADGKFQITKEQDRGGYAFSPMGFYSWIPASRANKDLSLGVTGGLGFQGDRPTVALGLTGTFNRNLALVGGVLMRSVQRLSAQYDSESLPIVAENLTEAQLHTSVYRPTFFFGVSFRFGENPFKGGDAAKPKEGDAPKDPAK